MCAASESNVQNPLRNSDMHQIHLPILIFANIEKVWDWKYISGATGQVTCKIFNSPATWSVTSHVISEDIMARMNSELLFLLAAYVLML